MKPKTDVPAPAQRAAIRTPATRTRAAPAQRLPRHERREQILAKAYQHFSEHGLNAQTRALAESCGVSQRLLYSFFPSKAALIDEVYRIEIAGSFKAIWFIELQDRAVPVEARLQRFYTDYFQTITTRRWLRLFLHASLADVAMAPAYIATIVTHMLGIVVAEAAHERGLRAPADAARVQEIGWVLHGAISHLAIRRHVYGNANPMPADEVIALQIRVFLAGLDAVMPAAPRRR
jgi:AcrR family transcriptional regulator